MSAQHAQSGGRERLFSYVIPGSLFVLIFGGWFLIEAIVIDQSTPSEDIDTFTEWIEWYPEADEFVIVSDSPARLMGLGPHVGFVVSGPSAYVFDEHGTLIDSTDEIGEANEFEQRWGLGPRMNIISQNAARDWFEQHEN